MGSARLLTDPLSLPSTATLPWQAGLGEGSAPSSPKLAVSTSGCQAPGRAAAAAPGPPGRGFRPSLSRAALRALL